MPVVTTCPECEAKLKFPDSASGKKVRCPKCQGIISLRNNGAKTAKSGSSISTTKKASSKQTSADDFGFDDAPLPIKKSDEPRRSSTRQSRRDDFDDDYDDYDDDRRDFDDDPYEEESSGMSTGAIISIVVGILGVLGIVAGVVIWQMNSDDEGNDDDIGGGGGFVAGPGNGGGGGRPAPRRTRTTIKNLDQAVSILDNGDEFQKVDALNWIALQPVQPDKHQKVSATVDPYLSNVNDKVRIAAMSVMVNWATKRNIPRMILAMKDKGSPFLTEEQKRGLKALAMLKDPQGAKAVAPLLNKFHGRDEVKNALLAIGAAAEDEVLAHMHSENRHALSNARRVLDELGTIEEKKIRQTLKDLSSMNQTVKRNAASYLETARVVPALQDEVAQALKNNLKNDRGDYDEKTVTTFAKWATEQDADVFADILEETSKSGIPRNHIKIGIKFLGDHPTKEGASALMGWIENFFVRGETINALKKIPGDIAELAVVKHMNSPNRDVQTHARQLLKEYGTKAEVMVSQIIEDINSEDKKMRAAAATSLQEVEVVETKKEEIALALNALLQGEDREEQIAAMKALQTWATKSNVPAVATWVADPNKKVGHDGDMKKIGIQVLANLQDERGIVPIAANLLDFFHKDEAAKALLNFGEKAEPAVITFLNNKDSNTRILACKILQNIGTEKSIKYLKRLIQADRIRSVQQQAAFTINVITQREKAKEAEKEKKEDDPDKDTKPDN